MIRLLKGIVEYKTGTNVVIDVNGVGYDVYTSPSFLSLITIGDHIKMYTHTHVRQDLLELYGFASPQDLELFEQLLSVSGIGPKTAVGIFSLGSQDRIIQAILASDAAFFSGVPRLGKKNAQKIIIELKNKVGSLDESMGVASYTEADNEVIVALRSFGFSQREIDTALRSLGDEEKTVSEKIRLALKYLGK